MFYWIIGKNNMLMNTLDYSIFLEEQYIKEIKEKKEVYTKVNLKKELYDKYSLIHIKEAKFITNLYSNCYKTNKDFYLFNFLNKNILTIKKNEILYLNF